MLSHTHEVSALRRLQFIAFTLAAVEGKLDYKTKINIPHSLARGTRRALVRLGFEQLSYMPTRAADITGFKVKLCRRLAAVMM